MCIYNCFGFYTIVRENRLFLSVFQDYGFTKNFLLPQIDYAINWLLPYTDFLLLIFFSKGFKNGTLNGCISARES